MNLKGTLPLLILKALESGPKHGYRIASEIKANSKGILDFQEGALYPALHDRENKGMIESFEEMEKGRMRRYYRLTAKGRKVMAKEREEWKALSGAVTMFLEKA
ncbi:MAG TPA: PadR family transcriptional regulator [Candidatus Hydrogenedentes bacterium]|nr:PadR family transcriptional regulator [Candidatus Hydrogenedentota bacterium]